MPSEIAKQRPPDPNFPPRFSRALVLSYLAGAGGQEILNSKKESSWEQVQEYLNPEFDNPWDTLEDSRDWLRNLADEEQNRIDWTDFEYIPGETPEYSTEKIDEINQKAKNFVEGRSVAWPGIESDILERIASGKGPRSTEIEDLLKPFRSKDTPGNPGKETYQEMWEIIQAWSERHYHGDKPEQRKELLLALKERKTIIACITSGRCSKDDLSPNDTRLRCAIYEFRPETATFVNQHPYNMLCALVANTSVADPDVREDSDLWFHIFENLLTEANLNNIKGHREKNDIKARIASARQRNDASEEERWTNEKREHNRRMFSENADELEKKLLKAREFVKAKVWKELKELTVAHTGLKSYYESLNPRIPLAAPIELCDETDRTVVETMEDQELVAGEVVQKNIDIIEAMNDDAFRRVRKFAGWDIPDKIQRIAEVKARMEEVGTAEMMLKVNQDTNHMWRASKAVLHRVEEMEIQLERLAQDADLRYTLYTEAYARLGPGEHQCYERTDIIGEGYFVNSLFPYEVEPFRGSAASGTRHGSRVGETHGGGSYALENTVTYYRLGPRGPRTL